MQLGIRNPVRLGQTLPPSVVHTLAAQRPEFAAAANFAVGPMDKTPTLPLIAVAHKIGLGVGEIAGDDFVLVKPLGPIHTVHGGPLIELITLRIYCRLQLGQKRLDFLRYQLI